MPGDLSLQHGEYYAHPRNRFWRLMERLLGVGHEAEYAVRIAAIARAGVALWDVLEHCERDGSLDASIVAGTEVPNDVAGCLERHASIETVVLNGKKAAASYRRLIEPQLSDALRRRVAHTVAPSTSPANAAFSLDRLVESWGKAAGLSALASE